PPHDIHTLSLHDALPILLSGEHLGWYRALWVVHVGLFGMFLLLLPTTKLRHMFTSPTNMYLRDRARPKGAMKPLPNLMETELETDRKSTRLNSSHLVISY